MAFAADTDASRRVLSATAVADRPVFLYIESDGMVKLVERDGVLTFPREGEVVDVELDFRGEMDFPEGKVLFAVPSLDAWPRDWTFKDDVPAMGSKVATIVQRAVNGSLVREVVGALAFHPDGKRILLVKASRGFTKGMWNIPGGFVTYAESPELAMTREMEEETGIKLRLEKLLGVFTQKFGSPYYMRGHMFLAHAQNTDLHLQKDEIADAQWFELADARRVLLNPFGRKALAALESGKGLALD